MIDKVLYDRIESLAEESIDDVFYALAEEFGELGLALHVEKGTKKRILKEHSTIECIDIILVAIEMYIKLGGNYEDLENTIHNKMNKWENNKNDRRNTLGEI